MTNTTNGKASEQHNAHVKARKALLRRVVDRAYSWDVTRAFRGLSEHDMRCMIERAAELALAEFEWPKGLATVNKSVPATVVHSIMCGMYTHAPQRCPSCIRPAVAGHSGYCVECWNAKSLRA